MKQSIALLGLMILGATSAQQAQACIQPIAVRSLFEVHQPGAKTLKALTGDHLVLEVSYDLAPANMDAKTIAQYDRDVIKLVAVVPAQVETQALGVVSKRYYFEVVDSGKTTLNLETLSNTGKIIDSQSQNVEALVRAIPKCK